MVDSDRKKGGCLLSSVLFILHAILLVGCLFAISSSDKPEFYRQDPNKKEEKITIKDSINVLRLNQPLRMLILAASTDKIASTIQTSVMTYFYIYAVGNIGFTADRRRNLYADVPCRCICCRFCCSKIWM